MNPDNKPPVQRERTIGPIRLFAIKTAIAAVAAMLFVEYEVTKLNTMVDARFGQIDRLFAQIDRLSEVSIGGRQFWHKVENELERQASPAAELSPEKKQKILAEIRTLSDRWRPFVKEALVAIAGDAEKSAASH